MLYLEKGIKNHYINNDYINLFFFVGRFSHFEHGIRKKVPFLFSSNVYLDSDYWSSKPVKKRFPYYNLIYSDLIFLHTGWFIYKVDDF